MEMTNAFLLNTLDTVKNNIAVVDSNFTIIYTNLAWNQFGVENGCPADYSWIGVNYFEPCEVSAQDGDEFGMAAVEGMHKLKNGQITDFQLEYPCHSPTEDRWFYMEINKFTLGQSHYFVISHQNITRRVQLEQEAMRLSKIDGLTGIGNRRAFDEFIDLEWHHCMRNRFPLSLMLIDIDDFKPINDKFGHQSGDDCLKSIAQVLAHYTERASDISARYGGDEFVVVWGHVTFKQAKVLAESILKEINEIEILDANGKPCYRASTSMGLATTIPQRLGLKDFIAMTDKLMYQAKASGKNKIVAKLFKRATLAKKHS